MGTKQSLTMREAYLTAALKAACRWLKYDTYESHIAPDRIDLDKMREAGFSSEYINDILTIRGALGKR